jgi:hypothetical protein
MAEPASWARAANFARIKPSYLREERPPSGSTLAPPQPTGTAPFTRPNPGSRGQIFNTPIQTKNRIHN